MLRLICKGFICFLCMVSFFIGRGVQDLWSASEENPPIGEMVWKGNVSVAKQEERWGRMKERPFPIFKGSKVRTECGMATVTLSNDYQIVMLPYSQVVFPDLEQVIFKEGEVNFRVPTASRTRLSVESMGTVNSFYLDDSKIGSPQPPDKKESLGTVHLSSGGSLTLRNRQGSIFVIDQDRKVVASLSSGESVRILSGKVLGVEKVRVDQVKKAQGEIALPSGLNPQELNELEKYLIDFSKALKGKNIPSRLNRDKFFKLLEENYQRKEIIDAVKKYEVIAENRDKSYLLTICDKQRKWRLYKDDGETLDFVDYPYWPEGEQIECNDPCVLGGFPWLPVGAAALNVGIVTGILTEQERDEDFQPICP